MSNKTIIKSYREENVCIKITDFQLRDVSIYGCDATLDFNIYDKETMVLLDTDFETIENAFMGVDDSEDLWNFLEEKGIDFSEEYNDDYDKLPAELKKEFSDYELSFYDDAYHEWFFDDDQSSHEDIIDRIMDRLYLNGEKIYVIRGQELGWIDVTSDYFGIHLHSDDVKIGTVYNVDMQDWIYEIDGIYFDVCMTCLNPSVYGVELLIRDDSRKYVVTNEDFYNDIYPNYVGKEGDILYDYYSE